MTTRERGRGNVRLRPGSKYYWAFFYCDGRLVRKSTGTADEKEAIKFLNAEMKKVAAHQIGARKYTVAKSGTFEAFAEQWVRDVLSTKKYSTQHTEASRLRCHILPAFGKLQVKSIGPAHVQAFIAKGKHPKTTKNCIALLRMLWTSARAWGYAANDWFDGVQLPEYQRPEAPHFSLEEMQLIITAAAEPHATFYRLAAETGMRLGELCALTVGNLHLDAGVIVVRNSSWHGHVGSTKSKRPRSFPLSAGLVSALRAQVAPVAGDPAAFVFRSRNGTPLIGDHVVTNHLKPLLKRLGIKQGVKHVGAHAFRHGNASLMDSENTPLKVRQERLGHQDGGFTLDVYTHASGDARKAADALGELLVPAVPLADMEPVSARWN